MSDLQRSNRLSRTSPTDRGTAQSARVSFRARLFPFRHSPGAAPLQSPVSSPTRPGPGKLWTTAQHKPNGAETRRDCLTVEGQLLCGCLHRELLNIPAPSFPLSFFFLSLFFFVLLCFLPFSLSCSDVPRLPVWREGNTTHTQATEW